MKNTIALVGVFVALLCNAQEKNTVSELQLDSILGAAKASFVLYNLSDNSYQVYNQQRAEQAFAVHSTSKILWSIIGLEENLIANGTDIVPWDSVKYPRKDLYWPKGFAKDHTLISALHNSVNWYYFELLNKMTPEMIEMYLDKLNYQQGFSVEKIHYFGLTFNLKKSAFDQITFLKSLYSNQYHLKPETLDIIKEGMLRKQTNKYTLYAKTGTGPIINDNSLGWLIGYVEKDSKVYFFAFNIEHEDELKVARLRSLYSKRILKALQLTD